MSGIDATHESALLRRIHSATHTLNIVATNIDLIADLRDVETRWEILVAAENLIDVAKFVTDQCRDIAWLHTPVPERDESEEL